MKLRYYIVLLSALFIYSCKSDSPVESDPPPAPSDFIKIITIDSANIKFEVWSATANNLVYGYNSIGFKVFVDNQPKNTGYVKFFPKMYHWLGSPMHSSPVSPSYLYNSEKELFIGYTSFLMPSDSTSFWIGSFNYNNEVSIDSASIVVIPYSFGKFTSFTDQVAGYFYIITLVNPYVPVQGPNIFQCLLHRTNDDIHYEEIVGAEMFIKPWMEAMGHGSSGNVNPVYIGGGIYQGKANFTMAGLWAVYDSIRYQSRFITPSPLPRFLFNVQ